MTAPPTRRGGPRQALQVRHDQQAADVVEVQAYVAAVWHGRLLTADEANADPRVLAAVLRATASVHDAGACCRHIAHDMTGGIINVRHLDQGVVCAACLTWLPSRPCASCGAWPGHIDLVLATVNLVRDDGRPARYTDTLRIVGLPACQCGARS